MQHSFWVLLRLITYHSHKHNYSLVLYDRHLQNMNFNSGSFWKAPGFSFPETIWRFDLVFTVYEDRCKNRKLFLVYLILCPSLCPFHLSSFYLAISFTPIFCPHFSYSLPFVSTLDLFSDHLSLSSLSDALSRTELGGWCGKTISRSISYIF